MADHRGGSAEDPELVSAKISLQSTFESKSSSSSPSFSSSHTLAINLEPEAGSRWVAPWSRLSKRQRLQRESPESPEAPEPAEARCDPLQVSETAARKYEDHELENKNASDHIHANNMVLLGPC